MTLLQTFLLKMIRKVLLKKKTGKLLLLMLFWRHVSTRQILNQILCPVVCFAGPRELPRGNIGSNKRS